VAEPTTPAGGRLRRIVAGRDEQVRAEPLIRFLDVRAELKVDGGSVARGGPVVAEQPLPDAAPPVAVAVPVPVAVSVAIPVPVALAVLLASAGPLGLELLRAS
jgi:hypothetical protein